MCFYIINSNPDENGRHEIHKLNYCEHLPLEKNRISLGYCASDYDALNRGKILFTKADGCHYCCPTISKD